MPDEKPNANLPPVIVAKARGLFVGDEPVTVTLTRGDDGVYRGTTYLFNGARVDTATDNPERDCPGFTVPEPEGSDDDA